jgi:hypothetical protein
MRILNKCSVMFVNETATPREKLNVLEKSPYAAAILVMNQKNIGTYMYILPGPQFIRLCEFSHPQPSITAAVGP